MRVTAAVRITLWRQIASGIVLAAIAGSVTPGLAAQNVIRTSQPPAAEAQEPDRPVGDAPVQLPAQPTAQPTPQPVVPRPAMPAVLPTQRVYLAANDGVGRLRPPEPVRTRHIEIPAFSGAAIAQSGWTYLECTADVTERRPDGTEGTVTTVTSFRFNAERAERLDPATNAWIHDCVEGDGYSCVNETVSDSEVRCTRAGTNAGGGELYFDRSIYRETGRYTVQDFAYDKNGAAHSWRADRECVTGRDPAGFGAQE
ncbi:hypothetical protein [Maricaulis sp.]|uniref:hypothetical protein n=1 Tax=Maricaulis sp. TaxID=1486257 RepID=UPI0025C436E3|nr:hypothetical protein [Maricaulis sp.]